MALISDLVAAIAEAEGIPEARVAVIARYTREAGFLSQGARGRNAPHATLTDCANLLIAVNAGGCVAQDAPQAVELYRGLGSFAPHGSRAIIGRNVEYKDIETAELQFLKRAATFGEILESVIDRFVGGELERFMKDEALKYLDDAYFQRLTAEVGDDKRELALHVMKSCENLLRLGTVSFRIEFFGPYPSARIVVDRSIGPDRELIAGVRFVSSGEPELADKMAGDRRDSTSIGYRTLMKISEVMQPA